MAPRQLPTRSEPPPGGYEADSTTAPASTVTPAAVAPPATPAVASPTVASPTATTVTAPTEATTVTAPAVATTVAAPAVATTGFVVTPTSEDILDPHITPPFCGTLLIRRGRYSLSLTRN